MMPADRSHASSPSPSSTFRLRSLHAGAMPEIERQLRRHLRFRRARRCGRDTAWSRRSVASSGGLALPTLNWPAMMPATCVPCPLTSSSGSSPPVKSRWSSGGRQLEVLVLREVRMSLVDSGVDDGPDDPRSSRGERIVRRVGLDRADRLVDERLQRKVRPDVMDGAVFSGGARCRAGRGP